MCTIIVVNHHYKEFPLVVAANRDEAYSRPSTPVQILSKEPLIIGGKDETKGGTWFGVNKQSIFVCGTNQGTLDKSIKTSRGHLIKNALKCQSIKELLDFVEDINPTEYNKFNLVFGDSKTAFVAHSYLLHSMVIRELSKGVHVISNDMKFTGETTQAQFIHKKLDGIVDMPWLDYYKALKKTLASSEYGVRVKPHRKEGKIYGHCTRSSTIAAFSDTGLERYKFFDRTTPKAKRSEGEPIAARYKDYIELWRNPDAPHVEAKSEEYETASDPPEDDDGPDAIDMSSTVAENMRRVLQEKFIGINNQREKSVEEQRAEKERLLRKLSDIRSWGTDSEYWGRRNDEDDGY